MPIPSAFVTRFFQLLADRTFAEAERVLKRLRKRVRKTEWNRGYLQALSGMLLAQKSGDQYVFLSNMNSNDKDLLRKNRREFLEYAKGGLHTDYDRGFFSAWAEYMRVMLKSKPTEQSKIRT